MNEAIVVFTASYVVEEIRHVIRSDILKQQDIHIAVIGVKPYLRVSADKLGESGTRGE